MTTTRTSQPNSTKVARSQTRQPQLLLISNDGPSVEGEQRWTLDEKTRETGRRGLAKARAALRGTRPPHLDIAA